MRQLKISKSITPRDTASMDVYLQEIGKVELIDTEEEVQLAQRIKQGDQEALERLTKANLRFVVSVAKQYQNQGLPLPDLINEGNLGLIKAAKKFDESKGFKFISYAVWRIRQSILQAITEHARIVRLPSNKVSIINKINKNISALEQLYERDPTIEEIAEVLQISEDIIEECMSHGRHHNSLDQPAPFSDDDSTTYLDFLKSEEENTDHQVVHNESLRKEIYRVLTTLTEREKEVIELFFGLNKKYSYGLSLEEIGDKLNITKERVRQLKEKALRRLKQGRAKQLKQYLGK